MISTMSENQKVPVIYIERTIAQADVVENLARKQKESGDASLASQLEVEMEKLAFFQNAAQGNHKRRAQNVIEKARSVMRGRAVTQPLPRLN